MVKTGAEIALVCAAVLAGARDEPCGRKGCSAYGRKALLAGASMFLPLWAQAALLVAARNPVPAYSLLF